MKTTFKACALIVGVLTVLAFGLSSRTGVKVEIENLGPRAMDHVEVDVSIRHLDNTGKEHTLFIDTYIEGGYSGKITAQVKNGKITGVKENIKLTPVG
jgi:hypothetical protein